MNVCLLQSESCKDEIGNALRAGKINITYTTGAVWGTKVVGQLGHNAQDGSWCRRLEALGHADTLLRGEASALSAGPHSLALDSSPRSRSKDLSRMIG